MRSLILLLSFLYILTSCENEPVVMHPTEEKDYSVALDTLKNYSDYILGEFDGKLLASTRVFGKSYSASIVSNPMDSSYIQFSLGYKLLETNIEKSAFVLYRFLETKTKLDTSNHYKFKNFSDFIDFFDRDNFRYYQINNPVENLHNVGIIYQNYYDIDNDIYSYNSFNFEKQVTPEEFYFIVDSINAIEEPVKKVEVYYSFECIGVNSYDDEMHIENGKGKSTFEY